MPNLQTPSHRGANGCGNLAFTTFVQILRLVSKFEENPFFCPVIQVHGNRQRNYNMHATTTGRRGCVWGGGGGSNLPQKSSTVLSEPKFGPP